MYENFEHVGICSIVVLGSLNVKKWDQAGFSCCLSEQLYFICTRTHFSLQFNISSVAWSYGNYVFYTNDIIN